ncbi:hypothetical protein [Lentibacter algarum]|jgi:hypothetical protein|uniref:hypothetical protein n=1 Tax=Lentibacter algarum TaxID=576131 RepID=UPI00235262DA|nr:hypothetical protein [Lentibacter algarum]MCO4827878.1 hypothetical protein [Lentibacter algarum]
MTNATKVFAAAALFVASTAPVAEAQMRPAVGYQSQWYTTPDGCSYSRTHAPGYGVSWVLIQNPHHINKPNVGNHCANTL